MFSFHFWIKSNTHQTLCFPPVKVSVSESRVSVYAGCTYPKPRVKLANRNLTKINGKYSAIYTAKSVHVLRLPCFLEKTPFEIFMPNFIFEHTFFLHHSPFLVLFITLHHRINLWSETNDSRSFPRVTSDG